MLWSVECISFFSKCVGFYLRQGDYRMKTKASIAVAVLAVVLAFSLCAFADQDEVVFEGQTFCLGSDDCQNFATWGPTAGGYVVLYEADGHTISDYIWTNPDATLTFESRTASGFALTPPTNDVFLGGLIENGQLQEIDQFFPAGATRPLFVLSKVDNTPEPSTLLLFGPAAMFLFGRARRLWRS
jgi:hypothetical protein